MKFELGGDCWKVKKEEANEREFKAIVPGDLFTDLIRNGVIRDPNLMVSYSEEQELVEKICKHTWIYSREFSLPAELLESATSFSLICEGLDTHCLVFVNGTKLSETENMFRRFKIPIPQSLLKKEGGNVLEFKFLPVVNEGESPLEGWEYAPEQLGIIKGKRQWTRKAGCHFGWDFCFCLPTCGIWRNTYIEALGNDEISIVDLIPTQKWLNEDFSSVKISTIIHFEHSITRSTAAEKKEKEGFLVLSLQDSEGKIISTGKGLQTKITFETNQLSAEITLTNVPKDSLWWPNGMGKQPIFILHAEIIDSTTNSLICSCDRKIGLRSIELNRGIDGKSFCFIINGEPMFCKGASWVPIDVFPGRITKERERKLLNFCLDANFNMIRCWGGGYYESESFYSTCDEIGLLVWQDFMFSCACYPSTVKFLENVREEIIYQVRRLSFHPSIAIWCGNNEIEEGAPFKCRPHESLKRDYETLFNETISPIVKNEDPSRVFVRSTPSRCKLNGPFDEHAGDISDGDSHWWELWHGPQDPIDFTQVFKISPKFCSEFGFQSLPSARTLRKSLPPKSDIEQKGIQSSILAMRQRSYNGNIKLLQAISKMTPRMSPATSTTTNQVIGFAKEVYISQCYQAIAVSTCIDHFRRLWPNCTGALFWQLNDIWATPSWSSVGFGEQPKMLHYFVKRSFAPVSISSALMSNNELLGVWISNDTQNVINGRIVARILNIVTGETITTSSIETTIDKATSELCLEVALPWKSGPQLDELEGLSEEEKADILANTPKFEGKQCIAIVDFKRESTTALENQASCEFLFDIQGAASILQSIPMMKRPKAQIIQIESLNKTDNTIVSLAIQAENGVCPFIWLDAGENVTFSDNGFTLRPRKQRIITAKGLPIKKLKLSLSVRCLWDALLS